jgi:F-type H+-transporting ATPase subunit c
MALLLGLLTVPLWAQEALPQGSTAVEPEAKEAVVPKTPFTTAQGLAMAAGCLSAAVSVVGGCYSIARIGSTCIESMARQPEIGGTMFAPMVVTAAMVEGCVLFAIVVGLLAVLSVG